MSINSLQVNQGDLQPYYRFTVDGVDTLEGATLTCTLLDQAGNIVLDNVSDGCYITDAAAKEAEYRWKAGETDNAGIFTIFFTITPQSGGAFDLPVNGATVEIVAVPAQEPITLAEVEGQIRYSVEGQESTVELLIEAVREKAEAVTRRALIVKQEVLTLDEFPIGTYPIEIPNPPLRSVQSIVYTDSNGDEITLDEDAYRIVFDTQNPVQPSVVLPVYGTTWPIALNDKAVVKVNYTCGYGSVLNTTTNLYELLAIPKAIKQWMLINVANLFDNRESVVVGNRVSVDYLTTLVDSLIANFRVYKW